MITLTPQGLFCPSGNFYIDPKKPVEHALITHAHSDHARKGSRFYYCVKESEGLLRTRLGNDISVRLFEYGEPFLVNNVKVSFHPAGHILGSSQVRIETQNLTWVISGDYKRITDPTCRPFEIIPCDVFITEATYGSPQYRWSSEKNIGREVYQWFKQNSELGHNSVLFAYSLGKAQRVLNLMADFLNQPIYCLSETEIVNNCYREQGIQLADTIVLDELHNLRGLQAQFIVLPPKLLGTLNLLKIPHCRTAFASGWMVNPSWNYHKGFVLSDHADWNDLVKTIQETGAKRVYVQHQKPQLIQYLKRLGIDAYSETSLMPANPAQCSLL